MSCDVRIIGVGNPLMADDGIGPAAIDALLESGLPEGIEALDGGLGGLNLLSYFEDVAQVVLIDAADLGRAPGTVVVAHFDAKTKVANLEQLSGHGGGIGPLLSMVQELKFPCQVVLVMVQPEIVKPHLGLSRAARRGLSGVIKEVKTLLAKRAPCSA